MKIEVGESLVYSWLRHVKNCRVVQSNWKISPYWQLNNEQELTMLLQRTEEHFRKRFDCSVFKKNASLSQILQQGECDAIGITIHEGQVSMFAVDVAFHENGLNYGSRKDTVMKVIAKLIRSALCLRGYMECEKAEIVFASPKINPAVLCDIKPCINEINAVFNDCQLPFVATLISNEDFQNKLLKPVLTMSDDVADTSELFLRSHQLLRMFSQSN